MRSGHFDSPNLFSGMILRDEIDFAVGPVSLLKEVSDAVGAVRPLLRTS